MLQMKIIVSIAFEKTCFQNFDNSKANYLSLILLLYNTFITFFPPELISSKSASKFKVWFNSYLTYLLQF